MRSSSRALLAVLLLAGTAWAHRVHIFAVVDGRRVLCQGYFASRKHPTKNCRIDVLLPDGAALTRGRTNDKGEFTFEATRRADLKIVLNAGSGHRAEWTVRASELPADLPAGAGSAVAEPVRDSGVPSTARASGAAVDEARVKAIVRSVVQPQILELRAEIKAAEQKGPGLTEIIGGIGYIVGIAGVVMYARAARAGSGERKAP